MITESLLGTAILLGILSAPVSLVGATPSAVLAVSRPVFAQHSLDLTTRLPGKEASQVFADNILLTLHYLKGNVGVVGNLDWSKVRQPFEATLTLEPGQIFAFHDTVLSDFKQASLKTTNAHFISREGYKPLAGLVGNGVCHLASLIHWVAVEAGLEVLSPVNHDFYPVPGVPREYGTSIRYSPTGSLNSPNQNLYIKNNFAVPVTFKFQADNESVTLIISGLAPTRT